MNWASNLPPLNLLLTKQETKAHIRAHLLIFGMKRLITVHHIIKKIKAHSDRIYNLPTSAWMLEFLLNACCLMICISRSLAEVCILTMLRGNKSLIHHDRRHLNT